MNFIKEFLYIFSLYMIFSAFHIENLVGEKEILRDGTCFDWFEHSVTQSSDSPMWSTDSDKITCAICNPSNTKKSWLITRMINTAGYKLIHVDIDIFRKYCKSCKNHDAKILILTQTLPNKDQKKSQEILEKLPVFTTLQNKEEDKSQTHHFQLRSSLSKFSIVVLSQGSCTRVEKIKISSFVCEKNVSVGVNLPRTVAPASGVTRVNVSCPESTLNPNNMEAYGLCSSDGKWEIISPCMCKKGFTLAVTKEGCKECQVSTYKDDVGNGKCYLCPRNSKSITGGYQCFCKDGFHRFIGDSYTHPCHGIPSAVRNIKLFLDITGTSMILFWDPPERSGAPDQNVLYDVECKKCQSGNDSKPCQDSCGTRVLYIPRQSDLENTSITVQNINPDTEYQIMIYSKNLNSLRINNSNWMYSMITFKVGTGPKSKLYMKTKPSMSTILLSVLVCVIFLLIVSYGIVKYKKRRRTPKLSASASIPVATVKLQQREVVVEPTQNNEETYYEAPDEIGIAPHEEVPNLLRSEEIRPGRHKVKAQTLEPSPYAELDKNRQDSRDTCNYQKLLKHDSGYLIPNDRGTETYENARMGKTAPGCKDLDRTKPDHDDNAFYQSLINK